MKRLILSSFIIFLALFSLKAQEIGFASWYGGKFHGRRTASGEIFDTNQFTAAHRSLPFGTIVKVTNLDNRKTTTVRINDRGPFVSGRIIDLSRAAAVELDMLKTGIAKVKIEVVASKETGDMYRIQIASFKKESNAQRLIKMLKSKNLNAIIEKGSNGITRVYIDQVSAADLEKTKKILINLGFRDFIIRKID